MTFKPLHSRARRWLTSVTLLLVAVGIHWRCSATDAKTPVPAPRLPDQQWVFLSASLSPLPLAKSSAQRLDSGGSAQITLELEPPGLKWEVYFTNLSGPATALGFYRLAAPANAIAYEPMLLIPIETVVTYSQEPPLRFEAKGRAALTAAQSAEVEAGRWVLMVSTAAFPQGELVGKVLVKPPGVGGV